MRADAKRNYEHLLDVARGVIEEHGAGASLRDIARKADVGLATLYRHFPSRDDLIDTLLEKELQALAARAEEIRAEAPNKESLLAWFNEAVQFFQRYRGVTDLMAAAYKDPGSALFVSCATVNAAGATLLERAQKAGLATPRLNGAEFFALIAAAGWLADQPSFADRSDHLVDFIGRAILNPA